MSNRGFFVTVEGIEGSGKSTQLQRLAELIRRAGGRVVLTKEPGGTPLADRIRAIVLDPQESSTIDPTTELLLYAASRRQHVTELLEPSVAAGATVLCDRYTDSTLAYQGFGRMLSFERLNLLNSLATGGLRPDLTLIYDLPEEAGLARAAARNETSAQSKNESRIEGEELRFHRRVREGYLTLALSDPIRYAVIDASVSMDDVTAATIEAVSRRLPSLRLASTANV
ncbi:MAG TPA: dTMP kinase [Thermoanaerobaculia bacterium]|nr:dTMP kinase [Thermoanaerobaculia bacterium]